VQVKNERDFETKGTTETKTALLDATLIISGLFIFYEFSSRLMHHQEEKYNHRSLRVSLLF
jgi:hypothetical protein